VNLDQFDLEVARSGRRRWRYGVAALALFALAVLAWGVLPFEDHVPLVLPPENAALVPDPSALPASASFECTALLRHAAEPEPSRSAVEALDLQVLTRLPCTEVREQRRRVVLLDLGLIVAGTVAMAWWWRSRRARAAAATAR
jgi:hypothetical protein